MTSKTIADVFWRKLAPGMLGLAQGDLAVRLSTSASWDRLRDLGAVILKVERLSDSLDWLNLDLLGFIDWGGALLDRSKSDELRSGNRYDSSTRTLRDPRGADSGDGSCNGDVAITRGDFR